MKKVVIYTGIRCAHCDWALALLSEKNVNFGVPILEGPISFKDFSKEKSVGNNWYSDDI